MQSDDVNQLRYDKDRQQQKQQQQQQQQKQQQQQQGERLALKPQEIQDMVNKMQEMLTQGRKTLDSNSKKASQEVERKDKKKRVVDINILEVLI
jgi:hypothetical protein